MEGKAIIFKAALFDLDGTLVDTEGQYSMFWGAVARKYRPDVPELHEKIKGTTLVSTFDRFFPDKTVQEAITSELNEFESRLDFSFYPGALDFIRDLRAAGVRTAIVTSSNQIKMSQFAKAHPDCSRMFDAVLTSEDFKASKPDPDCYLKAADVLDCEVGECAVFEDALTGLAAGMASGIFTFGLATTNPKELIAGKCDCVLDGWVGLTAEKCRELIESK